MKRMAAEAERLEAFRERERERERAVAARVAAMLLTATFVGSLLSFASLAVVHEYGPGECSREARARTELGATLREEAEATTDDAVSSPARTCWSSEPEERPPIDLAYYLCVRWARDDPEAMPVRVTMTPETQEQLDAILAERAIVGRDWVLAVGCFRVVEVEHPRAVPIREARDGEPAFRVAFVTPEPGERAEWADPREEAEGR